MAPKTKIKLHYNNEFERCDTYYLQEKINNYPLQLVGIITIASLDFLKSSYRSSCVFPWPHNSITDLKIKVKYHKQFKTILHFGSICSSQEIHGH